MQLDHIGVILKTERQFQELKRLLGLEETASGWVEKYNARCVMLEGHGLRIEAIFAEAGKLTEYNGGRGGVHHIAIAVEVDEELPGSPPLIETEPVAGIDNMLVNFVHPLAAGFPIEIVRRVKPRAASPSPE